MPFYQRKRIPVEETIAEESNAFPVSQCVVMPVDMTESDPVLQQLAETERLLQQRAKDYGPPEIKAVQAERGAIYGPPEVNMAAIAKCWSGLLMNYYKRTDLPDLTPAMVALMESAGTKACRLASTPTHPDSQLDYLSYGEIHHGLAR